MKFRHVLALIACLVAGGRASAQSIRPADYLPLGDGAQWQFERTAGGGPADLHLEVTDVNQTDTGTRYLLELPFEGGAWLSIGDVAGHGLEAASVMGQLRTAVRAYALEGHPPSDIVAHADSVSHPPRAWPIATGLADQLSAEIGRVRCRSCAYGSAADRCRGRLPPASVVGGRS